jgi:glycosyltransferase involved in cell wall biosynthesis
MPENLIPPAEVQLAIVIPAYKAAYLRECLQAIAVQTDRRFHVYLGDDCSPEPLADIVREFSAQLPITYHRCERNLGGKSLVQQWERCLNLTREPWIWLFSDDDFMDKNCVAAFYAELERTEADHDVYRFDTTWVDGRGQPRSQPESITVNHPVEETGAEFLLARMAGSRNSTLQEIIFSRLAWKEVRGIPAFPLAWCSDDAFIAQLGSRRTIRTITTAKVYWRLSDINISSNRTSATTRVKIRASDQFVRWVTRYFQPLSATLRQEASQLSERWFLEFCRQECWYFISLPRSWELEKLARAAWRRPFGWGFMRAQRLNWRYLKSKLPGRR